MDSTEIPVYGQQEHSAYNGHFESICYHPLLLFNGRGDCLSAKLRAGYVHSAEDWEEVLLPEIDRQQSLGKEVVFRADAAFAKPEIYEALEERGVKYAIRTPANDSLERDITELLTRPVGRPSHKPVIWYRGFLYQRRQAGGEDDPALLSPLSLQPRATGAEPAGLQLGKPVAAAGAAAEGLRTGR
jgi:hypothetical protein